VSRTSPVSRERHHDGSIVADRAHRLDRRDAAVVGVLGVHRLGTQSAHGYPHTIRKQVVTLDGDLNVVSARVPVDL